MPAMDVFCFDFDGVICDSAPETAVTAWRGCRELWPLPGVDLPVALQERFCRLRPVLHTGFEAIPLMRLIERGDHDDAEILDRFPELRDALMTQHDLSAERLQAVFGSIRDRQIEQDADQWLEWNRFYPGMSDLLAHSIARHPTYVITTKQRRFASLLLAHNGVRLPEERIFGLEENRPKPAILESLMRRPEHDGATFHFIEDRLETLQSVIDAPALTQVRIYLADWGYNTPLQRESATRQSRIHVVSLAAFRAEHDL